MKLFCLFPIILLAVAEAREPFAATKCDGDYKYHLQGVCTNRSDSIYWSFTTDLVKSDQAGKIQKSIGVESHHGDLCFYDGKIYVAVNLGRFNDPKGNADSRVYVYDADTLEFLSKHEVQGVFHGAGGMAVKDGHFFVVGGLPDGVQENYVYEYDSNFKLVKKHIVESGWTRLGIQTVEWHDGSWWFGCYGSPKILIKTDPQFQNPERFEFDCSLGIVGIGKETFLVAKGPRTPKKRCLGTLHVAVQDEKTGLRILPD